MLQYSRAVLLRQESIPIRSLLLQQSTQAVPQVETNEIANAKPYDSIPGPRRLPLIGTLYNFLPYIGNVNPERLHEYHLSAYKKYGPIWREVLPGIVDMVFVGRPTDMEIFLRAENATPFRFGFESLKVYREDAVDKYSTLGLLILQGEEWRKFRSQVQPVLLKPKIASLYINGMQKITEEFIQRIVEIRDVNLELPKDFQNELYKWALESVGLVAFNTHLGCLKPNLLADSDQQLLINSANDIFRLSSEMEIGAPTWKYFRTATWKKYEAAQEIFTRIGMTFVNNALETIQDRLSKGIENEEPMVLELLLHRNVNERDACVMALDMLIAGIDTTSHSVAFVMYHLAKNPDKQEILHRELCTILPNGGELITDEMLESMKYLKACVKESSRITPVVAGTVRKLHKDLVLSGYHIPKGVACVSINHLVCGLSEHYPNPNSFIPERWIKGHELQSKAHPFTYLPFGHGTRMCIGRRFAELEMWLVLSKLIRNYRIEYHHEDIGILTRMVQTPDQPLRFKIIERK